MIDDPTTDDAQWDGATKPSTGSGSTPAPASDTHVPKPSDAGRRPPLAPDGGDTFDDAGGGADDGVSDAD